jgi:pimeloyl-ACP methyl ester carboxylesterase
MGIISRYLLFFGLATTTSHGLHLSRKGVPPRKTSLQSTLPSETPAPHKAIRDEQVELNSGVKMQVMSCVPTQKTDKPTLLFLHGSFHAAWCWAEHFIPFFVSKGYPVVAPSWRGTGGTKAGEGVKKVKIMEHVADLESLLDVLPEIVGWETKPVIICHSFGGLAAMKLLELYPDKASKLGGIVTMCSVPPSGNGKLTMRYLRRSLRDSYKITAGFAMKKCLRDASLCRELFFGGEKRVIDDEEVEDYGISDEDVFRYQSYFARDSEATIDLFDLAKKLPSLKTTDGKAPFVGILPPCLVMGGKDDFIVDSEGVEETATYFGLQEPLIVDSPHDVMLGRKWTNAANALDQWLQEKVVGRTD